MVAVTERRKEVAGKEVEMDRCPASALPPSIEVIYENVDSDTRMHL